MMVVVFNTNVTVLAVPAVSRDNHSAFGTGFSFMFAKVVSRMRDDAWVAERNYQIGEWFSNADDGSNQSEVDVFSGR